MSAESFANLLFFMFAVAVIGEPLRVLFSRLSRLFKGLDILQILTLDVFLGGLILYVIAIMPFGLFSPVTMWIVTLFALSFVLIEFLIRRPRFPKKYDTLRCVVVFSIFLVALLIRFVPVSDLIFGSIHDTSLHSLFVQVLLENEQVPALLQPYAAEGIIYPQGFHPIVAYVVCISDWFVPSAVLHITTLFSAMAVLGAYYIGKALSSRWYFGVSLALVSAFIAPYPKYITWGSNAFVASIPLYFVCLSLVPLLLKEKREFGVSEILIIGILFGYLGAVHLQPYETLIASMGLWWLIDMVRRKREAFPRALSILVVFLISLIMVSPFFFRWLIWRPYPHHNIGLPEDVEIPMETEVPYLLSNYSNIPYAILQGINYFVLVFAPGLKVIYFVIVSLAFIVTIAKRKRVLDNRIAQTSLVTIGGQMLVLLFAEIFVYSLFSAQPIFIYLSLEMIIGLFSVWLCRTVFLRLSKMAAMKVNSRRSRLFIRKDWKALLVALLGGVLLFAPFVYRNVVHDVADVRGAYGVWAITTTDDLELMLWMRDNLPCDCVVLVNPYESGLFIPSVSYRKIIFPRIASRYSHSYQTLSTLLENWNLNATAHSLMNHFEVTHVFVGSLTSIFEMYKHKWDPQLFLQNPNFDLVERVGNAYLFAVSHKYPGVVFQDDFEYDSPDETEWRFNIAKECEGTGFGEATMSSNDTYHGNRSLMITARRDKEWYYVCSVCKNMHVGDASNVTLSFYLNATSGFNNDLDHSAVIIADASEQRTITLSTSYAYISQEYIELPYSQGFFEFNLSEIWYRKHNSTLPIEFSICLKNFDTDGVENVVFFDYVTLACNDT